VDTASTATSLDTVSQFVCQFERFKLIRCERNSGGPALPRNIGIRYSEGDFIAFLDSDDVWYPEKLEKQIQYVNDEECNFLCSSARLIDDHSAYLSVSRDKPNRYYGVKDELFSNRVVTSSVLVSRALLGDLEFDESQELVTCEDYFLWLNLLNKAECKFIHIGQELIKYRVLFCSLGNIDGKYRFAMKYLLASVKFLVESKSKGLVHIVLLSSSLRFIKLALAK
jgi:teichuronic acid biosynthesis glycosyltransferase TuaG